eukprot:TRINITY_DN8669_c0_g1_i1.p2 TRINITY_DN8669_c0_g1~~TRINITY_DN8669_c0_g1_i1.p2  ORF type:complete len:391 (-),score=85.46 TRINITY_DN8669_c0_g1_i1:1389-2561(-)
MNIPQSYYPYYTGLSQYGLTTGYQSPIIKSEYDSIPGLVPPSLMMGDDDSNAVDQSALVEEQKDFGVNVRPEIRKGCVWEIQFRLSDSFLNEFPLTKMVAKVSSIEKEDLGLKDGEFSVVLKIRSKLIEPIKEVPFDKVAECVSNSLRIDVSNGTAVLRVKFTARPRNIFHKHADVMILVASLYRGEELLAEDNQELIFRGGTGSAHSAENRKLSVLKKNNSSNNMAHSNYPNITHLYSSPVMYPYTVPSIAPTMTVPQPSIAQPQQQTQQSLVRAEALTVPELDEFDSDTFFSDFLNNKGDSLNPFEAQEQTNSHQATHTEFTNNASFQQRPVETPAFNFTVTGFEIQPNGLFQGTIEGVYLNKPFRGSFQTSITDSNLQGSFSGSFTN